MCKTWGRIRMRIVIILMLIRIGINIEILIRIGIKAIHNTAKKVGSGSSDRIRFWIYNA
jgi:hypothetical protein